VVTISLCGTGILNDMSCDMFEFSCLWSVLHIEFLDYWHIAYKEYTLYTVKVVYFQLGTSLREFSIQGNPQRNMGFLIQVFACRI